MNIAQLIGQKLLLAFEGKDRPSDEIVRALREYRPGGITLFRALNIDNPAQVRQLTDQLQRLAGPAPVAAAQAGGEALPLLIAADQEGGQLMAVGEGTTPLPGNMALGATRSAQLARRAGEVLGRELAAMGINVNYAPCVDVNVNLRNPVVGTRSFGEDPQLIGELAGAMIEGIQSQGVVATAKHFPGHGDTARDSHHELSSVPHSLERLQAVELPPFRAAIRAGVKAIITAHLALPALDGPDAPPASLSRNVLQNLLRHDLGFEGVIITDAMNMLAIRQGEYLGEDSLRAVKAGADLLLLASEPKDQERVFQTLIRAAQDHGLDQDELLASVERVLALKQWLASQSKPDTRVVGCADHRRVADEVAERSITLVRDHAGLLPIRLRAAQRVAVLIPKPQDLTPADTSSYITPVLAGSLRTYHAAIDEYVIPYAPGECDIAELLPQLKAYDLVVIGTLNAIDQAGQQQLVREALKAGIPTIVVALRLPYDLAAFPEAPTYICTYSILEPSMRALARGMFGHIRMEGCLPVAIPGLYPAGHRLDG